MNAFLLHHERELDDGDDIKFIGVYATQHEAEMARSRAIRL